MARRLVAAGVRFVSLTYGGWDMHTGITAGMRGAVAEVETQEDRAAAIASAIGRAGSGDIVVVAGKGHEPYQEVAGVYVPFSDVEVARVAIERRSTAR